MQQFTLTCSVIGSVAAARLQGYVVKELFLGAGILVECPTQHSGLSETAVCHDPAIEATAMLRFYVNTHIPAASG